MLFLLSGTWKDLTCPTTASPVYPHLGLTGLSHCSI
uniref:Uncharacterized protein n=1 Tax=Anguilla anguilla TaxID=7936 RepID=A0A0E9QBT3_ANGAN